VQAHVAPGGDVLGLGEVGAGGGGVSSEAVEGGSRQKTAGEVVLLTGWPQSADGLVQMLRSGGEPNVLVAASKLGRGASAKLLSLIGSQRFDVLVSVPLVIEYEDALMRGLPADSVRRKILGDILEALTPKEFRTKIGVLR
jgi:hypothetical protein